MVTWRHPRWIPIRGSPNVIIVSASDDNFVPGLLILLYSAWINNPTARFHVIDAGIRIENVERIRAFCARHGIDCSLLRADVDALTRLPDPKHWTSATYARLFLPDLLPDAERAIYVDADAIVTSDIGELWTLDLGGHLVAGVADGSIDRDLLERVGIAFGDYINAGVLVMNLAQWRREGTTDRMIRQLMDHPDLAFADQTAINIVARGRILRVAPEFNVFARDFSDRSDLRPRIIHYTGQFKPWSSRISPMTSVFDAYRMEADAGIPAPPLGWDFKRIRRTLVGLIGLRPKYWRPIACRLHYQSAFITPHIRELRTRVAAARRIGAPPSIA
jgi:lipopolysaccharide biosynthesis glycosyltransferase